MPQDNIAISIVMTYFERLAQLKNTLNSFQYYNYDSKVEVIIVDDGSVIEPALSINVQQYNFIIKIITVSPDRKWYQNPCIPFNIGFAAARGDIIIVQNAECLHYSNILEHAQTHLLPQNYLSYSCYSIDEIKTKNLSKYANFKESLAVIKFGVAPPTEDGRDGWYNHSRYNPVAYHFCSAITRDNLIRLKGFDERYASGIGYDDNEILERIRRSPLKVEIIDEAVVVHQYHYSNKIGDERFLALYHRNKMLYHLYTKRGGHAINYCFFLIDVYIFLPPWRLMYRLARNLIRPLFR